MKTNDEWERMLRDLVSRCQAGDEQAEAELLELFEADMLDVARSILRASDARGALDSTGVVQSGFRVFFERIRRPDFDSFKGSVGGLLAAIVRNKARAERRRPHLVNYDPHGKGAIDVTSALTFGTLTEPEAEAYLREKLAPIKATLTDSELEILCFMLDPSDERPLTEVAAACKRSVRTVKRTRDRFEKRLRTLFQSEARNSADGRGGSGRTVGKHQPHRV